MHEGEPRRQGSIVVDAGVIEQEHAGDAVLREVVRSTRVVIDLRFDAKNPGAREFVLRWSETRRGHLDAANSTVEATRAQPATDQRLASDAAARDDVHLMTR